MGGFFRKSGNGQGVFPDTSIEEERSLFTNDEECGSCTIADGVIPTPTPPDLFPVSCTPAEPNVEEISPEDFIPFYQYSLVRNFEDPEVQLGYIGKDGPVVTSVPACEDRGCTGFVFCAQPNSITFNGDYIIASNETCSVEFCIVIPELTRFGNC